MTDIGFIGLGTMGAPMARNLLRKGHRLTVHDIAPAAMAAMMVNRSGVGQKEAT